jgi:hypothetical protein
MKIQVIKSRPIQEPISSCQLKIRSEADRERSARQKYAVNRSVQIRNFLRGFANTRNVAHLTSQDAAHTAIMLHHGGFAFMPSTSYAINIGKRGLHSRPAFYYQHRAQTRGPYPFFPAPVPLSETKLDAQSVALFEKSVNYKYW